MMLKSLAFSLCFIATGAVAGPRQTTIDAVLDQHVLPRMQQLSESAADLSEAAVADCTPAALRGPWSEAFDAWIGVSHLRFGPAETASRGFALAFWPDTRGRMPKALSGLIADADPVVEDPARFAEVSIAGRGFYALELMLYDPAFAERGEADYRCALIRAMTADIAATAGAIFSDWTEGYAAAMRNPGSGPYKDESEVLQELFKALDTGLQINADLRLGRPLGSFERPRPERAETRRSGRSLENVRLSMTALRQLAVLLAGEDDRLSNSLAAQFDVMLERAEALQDPVFAGVTEPQSRFRIEALQQSVNDVRTKAVEELGPALGVAAGFNAMDGD